VDQGSNQMAAGDAPQRVEKIVGAEQRIYKQMSLLCNAFCFRESYWNQSTAGDDFMVRLVEFEEDGTEKDDARWMTVYCNGVQKAYESAAEEYDAAFSDKPADREIKEYNTLYHAAKATVSPETAEKVFPITAAQSYCITRILKAIRPLHYSTALGAKAFRESERKRVAKEAEEAEKQRIAKEEADAAAAVAAEAEAAEKEDAEVKEEEGVKRETFEPCTTFQGARPGFVFKLGPRGLGYYRDRVQEEKVKEEKKEKVEKVEKPAVKKEELKDDDEKKDVKK